MRIECCRCYTIMYRYSYSLFAGYFIADYSSAVFIWVSTNQLLILEELPFIIHHINTISWCPDVLLVVRSDLDRLSGITWADIIYTYVYKYIYIYYTYIYIYIDIDICIYLDTYIYIYLYDIHIAYRILYLNGSN